MPKLVSGNFIEGRIDSWHCDADFVAWAEELRHMQASASSKCVWVPSPADIEEACAALREQADADFEEWWSSIPLENMTAAEKSRLKRATGQWKNDKL